MSLELKFKVERASCRNADPDILGGTPVFIGTRVSIKTLLDYLEAGIP